MPIKRKRMERNPRNERVQAINKMKQEADEIRKNIQNRGFPTPTEERKLRVLNENFQKLRGN
jgi:hypothetical protein